MSPRLRIRPVISGGIVGYPSERLYEEVACIAAHFHWSLADIISLDHGDRRRWVAEIARLMGD